jgi:glycosyltransferase involved in cell wall biosynthesis
MMGTRGVPALYGGFETAVEEIGSRLAARGHEVTVYCRNPGQTLVRYRGMRLVNVPAVRHRVAETLSHSAVSTAHAIIRDRPDAVLLMNAANAPLLQPLKAARIPTAIHLDGLESRREKWRGAGARYFRWAEKASVRWGQEVIADADAIAAHVQERYGRACVVIPYGAAVMSPGSTRLTEVSVEPGGYHLVVARFEPENHVLEAVHGFRRSTESRDLLVVGSAPYSQWYVDKVRSAGAGDARIRFLGGVYDQDLLDELYGNACTYVHGHSVGGTNPSLLRAMGAGAPVLAYDVEFNREVTGGAALFWGDADDLTAHLDRIGQGGADAELASFSALGQERVSRVYQWDNVTDQYEDLLRRLVARR